MNADIVEFIIVTRRYYSLLPINAQILSHLNFFTVQIFILNTSQRLLPSKNTPGIQNNNSQQLWVFIILAVLSCTRRCKVQTTDYGDGKLHLMK
jgi:hypothetical protein